MRRFLHILTAILAAALALSLIGALSDGAAGLLVRLWAICGPLCLMALLERGRRGVTRRGGGLDIDELSAMAMRAAALGLLVASLAVAAIAFAAYTGAPG